jgi:membrane protease YdiL (CAAX protease family)
MRSQAGTESSPGTDTARDLRRVLLYAAGLVAVYLVGVGVIIATHTQKNPQLGVLIIMFAPMVGALLARFAGPGVIRWGRLSWWILAGLIPVVTVFVAYAVGSPFGVDVAHYGLLGKALLLAPILIVLHSLTAVGEETGWRGFLWPLMRRRWSFPVSALVIGAVWWTYHVPLIVLGWYGSLAGLPAFTVAIAGITLFTGVLTDRSRAIWPSVIAHGAWNALATTGFVLASGFVVASDTGLVVFSGNTFWVGEFGWLAAIASLVTGTLAAWWHLSRPMPEPLITPAAPTPAQQAPESSHRPTVPLMSLTPSRHDVRSL